MKIILDTNVLVSGIFWQGIPARILDAWTDQRFRLVVSPPILEEYQEVVDYLTRKYPSITTGQTILQAIAVYSDIVEPVKLPKQICTDPDDDKFIAAGLSGQVDYVVSGDVALLKTDGYLGLRVVKPSVFFALL